jgi:hypothetical protein
MKSGGAHGERSARWQGIPAGVTVRRALELFTLNQSNK